MNRNAAYHLWQKERMYSSLIFQMLHQTATRHQSAVEIGTNDGPGCNNISFNHKRLGTKKLQRSNQVLLYTSSFFSYYSQPISLCDTSFQSQENVHFNV